MTQNVIVMYPSPGRSHLVPMVELAQLILTHHPSFSITIIISTAPYDTGSTSGYIAAVSSGVNFIHLPTISLSDNFKARGYNPILSFEFAIVNNPNLHKTLFDISGNNPIQALIIDMYCSPAVEVSGELNIPTYFFFPSGASALATFLYLPTIHKNINRSLKDDMNMVLNVPGLPSFRVKEMPSSLLDRSSKVYSFFLETSIQMAKSAGLIRNTFDMFEKRAISAILNGECVPDGSTPPIYCIGPLISTADERDDHECLSWLDSQPSRSVLFISFGSMGLLSSEQLQEMAIGLEKSGVRFLWVVRNPPQNDKVWNKKTAGELALSDLLPEGFFNRTKDRGLVVYSWAPQVAVLNHDSVGGFVCHCGWNSVLESVVAGVPILAWPLFAEQKLNNVFLVEEAKLAIPVAPVNDGFVTAGELEKRITELMESDEGKRVRERVLIMRNEALAATSENGSSRMALNKLAESFRRGRK